MNWQPGESEQENGGPREKKAKHQLFPKVSDVSLDKFCLKTVEICLYSGRRIFVGFFLSYFHL